ncbi:phosphoenolpyruvate--protein phosphotransferase [Actinomycetospora sp. TBRC 11914]|uniref:phosphoenolpyruvate--protein phosphotransferase n=1 Tax=Actinomycetospora sp. TBRC 11914 TaxID=2729387 RepID=UPI00145CDA79|nr:phosphoenolpyruvate--protein phosphotransferase [Actinomycetospora sp. TBRC 11914]NMO89520.1 phosphoenolpyruvate--protein phosphotransferase [Actinomycetospora sp. TBRC 11914]
MTVGIVVVSHSRALADAAVGLAGEMVRDGGPVEVAAGLDDGGFGTDAVAIADALARAEQGDGVVVLMDLGSAVLSAELALELLDDAAAERVVLCPAPLVEGLVVAAVSAAGGAPAAEVAAEAADALEAKTTHLAPPGTGPGPAPEAATGDEERGVFTVRTAHGVHARPAARLVGALRGLDADVRLRNLTLDGPEVSAASMSKVATLGALEGHEVAVRARGAEAGEAVRRLLAVADDDFGEAPEATAAAAPSPPAAAPAGGPLPASPGIGVGPVRAVRAVPVDVPPARPGTPAEQRARLDGARAAVRDDLRAVRDRAAREIGEAEAAVFDAQLLLLDDPDVLTDATARTDAGADAARAWADVLDEVEARFAGAADEYLRARARDVRDVRDRVLRALGGVEHPGAGGEGILVADDLTPADAAALDPARTPAVVLAGSSPTAHAAILLRARGVPAVVGAGAALITRARQAAVVAVDGTTGEVVVDPDPATLAAFRDRAGALERRREAARRRAHEPAVTRDGTRVLVGANVGGPGDARAAVGADLAGLVRTEFCFLDRHRAPDVDEQETAYRAIAEAMGGRVTLRTLDVGGDKPLDYLPLPPEPNPFLGVRGIRLALARPRLLADQLEAIVRVAHDHPVDVMFPMVATVDELVAARRALDDAVGAVGRGRPPDLRVGIMVEIPATALKAAAFAPLVDFLSIGTNDLTQYALAAERGNDAVAALGDALDPGVLALVAATADGARSGDDVLVAVCGELAGDEQAAALLVGLGVRELSVAPTAVAAVKQAVRDVDLASARELAAAALRCPDAEAVRGLLR